MLREDRITQNTENENPMVQLGNLQQQTATTLSFTLTDVTDTATYSQFHYFQLCGAFLTAALQFCQLFPSFAHPLIPSHSQIVLR